LRLPVSHYEAQVFLSREDNQPITNFTAAVEKAQAPAGRYVQAAQDEALKTALDNAFHRRGKIGNGLVVLSGQKYLRLINGDLVCDLQPVMQASASSSVRSPPLRR